MLRSVYTSLLSSGPRCDDAQRAAEIAEGMSIRSPAIRVLCGPAVNEPGDAAVIPVIHMGRAGSDSSSLLLELRVRRTRVPVARLGSHMESSLTSPPGESRPASALYTCFKKYASMLCGYWVYD